MSESPSGYQPTERRPLNSRSWAISNWLAHRLAVAGASPNLISVAGMIAACVGGLLFAGTTWWSDYPLLVRAAWLAGAACMQLRLIANLLDGMVAIERRVASPVGELYNEVPDRISDAAAFIGLGYAAGGSIVWGLLAALSAVFTAYIRAMAKVAGAPQDYCGPMAKPQRMFLTTVVALYCGLSPLAWQPTWNWLGEGGLPALALAIIAIGGLLTALRRLWRAANFLARAKS